MNESDPRDRECSKPETQAQAVHASEDLAVGRSDAPIEAEASEGEGSVDTGPAGSDAPPAEAQTVIEGEPAEASSADEAGSDEASEEGEGDKRKKRRRKRKKKPSTAPLDPAKAAQVPFLKYFETGAAKRHAFAVGEIVAGRIERVEHGAAIVDLFGKASATMDALEPTEIADLPEPPAAHAETAADDLASAAAVDEEPEVAADEAAPAGETPVEAITGAAPAGETPVEAVTEAAPADAGEAPADAVEAAPAEEHSEPLPSAMEMEAAPPGDEATEAAPASETTPAEPPRPTAPPIGEQRMAEAPPEVGTIFRGRVAAVSESGHIAILNRAVDRSVAKATLREAQDKRTRVEGLVYGFNRGGFDVLVEGIRAFCPASGMSLGHLEDPHEFLGRKVEFTVPPSKGGKSIVVSRRAVLEKELRRAAKERLKNLTIGEDLEGTITQVRDYGLLVDIGEGVEGLVHQSEVSWSRGVRPGDVGKPGDSVKVRVLRVQPMTRKERHGRVSLSLRACQPDPWDAYADVIKEGHAQKATVVRTTEFGAFMKLAPGVEGLLHISELGGKDLKHAKLAVDEGEELAVLVERVDREQRRISLSRLSQVDAEKLDSGELAPQSFTRPPRQGAHVFVVIERVEHHGILAQVEGVAGRKGRAYIPNRELADDGGDRKRTYAAGSKVEVKVLSVDRDGQLRCSVRARLQDEERKAVKEYRKEAARQGFGTFGDLLRAKLGGDSSS